GVHFNGFTVYHIWLVTPLPHSIDSGLREYWQTALDSHILHATILADHGHQHYRPFNPRPASLRRILRRNVVDQVRLGYSGGDTDSLNRRRLGRFRNDGHASRAAQHFAKHSTGNSADHSARDSPDDSARCVDRRWWRFLRHTSWGGNAG